MRNQEPVAHINEKNGKEQSMEAHLQGVAAIAEKFASEFGNGDWAKLAGLWHDLGKYNPKWQEYLRNQTEGYYNQPENEEE